MHLAWTAHAAAPNSVQSLIDRAARAVRTDPEISKRDAEAALRLLQRNPDADLEIRARLLLCDYQSERDPAAAEREIAQATALLPRAKRPALRAGLRTCSGEIRETAGHTAEAATLYEQAVAIAADAHDDEMLAGALFARGYLLGVQGEYAAGLNDLRHSRTLYEQINMPHHALTALDSIAILYNRMGDYAQAVHIYTQALKQQRAAGMQREVAVTLHNLGRAHENLQEWPAARLAFAESLEINLKIGYTRGEAYALRGLAAAENAAGDASGALETLARAQEFQRQTPDARLRAQIQLARGVTLHQLHRLPESLSALEEAAAVFRDAQSVGELSAAYAEIAVVQADSGNWRLAYERLTDYKSASDRLLKNQLDQRFATLKVEFDTAAKEKENALLLRENAANAKALAQERRVGSLQAVVIVLTAMLAALLATFGVRQRRSNLQMRELAMTDELTRAPNRRAVLGRLEALRRAPQPTPCATLIIDIDHFKSINDYHGHPAGDEVLKVVADKLRSAVREPAFFGRLGGEEFLIVLPESGVEQARQAAERFREHVMSIDTSRWYPDRRRITASLGVTVSTSALDTPSSMLKRADAALYAAKRGGRNCVRVDPEEVVDANDLVSERQAS